MSFGKFLKNSTANEALLTLIYSQQFSRNYYEKENIYKTHG